MQKCLTLEQHGEPLLIKSAIHSEGTRGQLYVEAPKVDFVQRATRGMELFFSSKPKPVAVGEWVETLRTGREAPPLRVADWVRMRRGLYKGDLAQVGDYLPHSPAVHYRYTLTTSSWRHPLIIHHLSCVRSLPPTPLSFQVVDSDEQRGLVTVRLVPRLNLAALQTSDKVAPSPRPLLDSYARCYVERGFQLLSIGTPLANHCCSQWPARRNGACTTSSSPFAKPSRGRLGYTTRNHSKKG